MGVFFLLYNYRIKRFLAYLLQFFIGRISHGKVLEKNVKGVQVKFLGSFRKLLEIRGIFKLKNAL